MLFLAVRLLFTTHANVVWGKGVGFKSRRATKRYGEATAPTTQRRKVFEKFARRILGILYESRVAHLAERNTRHGSTFLFAKEKISIRERTFDPRLK